MLCIYYPLKEVSSFTKVQNDTGLSAFAANGEKHVCPLQARLMACQSAQAQLRSSSPHHTSQPPWLLVFEAVTRGQRAARMLLSRSKSLKGTLSPRQSLQKMPQGNVPACTPSPATPCFHRLNKLPVPPAPARCLHPGSTSGDTWIMIPLSFLTGCLDRSHTGGLHELLTKG